MLKFILFAHTEKTDINLKITISIDLKENGWSKKYFSDIFNHHIFMYLFKNTHQSIPGAF